MASVESSNIANDQANNNIEVGLSIKQEIKDERDSEDYPSQQQTSNDTTTLALTTTTTTITANNTDGGGGGITNTSISNSSNCSKNGTSNDDNDNEKTNLIVNYLPQNMADEDFEELFKKFGPMKSCKIVRNRSTGYSYGFGFVDFETHEQAIKAIEELNGHELSNKKIKVAFARPAGQDIKQANLYIKNVPNEWSQDDVRKVFEPYGNIIQVRVLGDNRGVAFVLYDLRKQAEDALEALNGKTVDGCETPLEIKFAADKKSSKEGGNKNSSNNNNSNNSNGTNSSGNNNASGEPSQPRKRERGTRGGRNRDNYRRDRHNRQQGQRSFFDNNKQRNYDDRQQNSRGGGGGGQSQYNPVPYGAGAQQYQGNLNNNMNGIGPVRQAPVNRANRFTPMPFVQVQQPMIPTQTTTAAPPMIAQMAPNPMYGFQIQQQQIPFPMQLAPTQPVNQAGQLVPNQMSMYGAAQMPIGYTQITPNALSNIYSVQNNNTAQIMNNAANMQIGQPMRGSSLSNDTNDGHDSTLFVYNLGPDIDESGLKSMFQTYGEVLRSNVVRKTPGGESKGYGFVTFRDRDQANSAIAGLNGSMRNGRTLQVSMKK